MTEDRVGIFTVAGGYVARLDGEIDLAVADAIEGEITRRTGPAGFLVLDLTGVSFLDSSGVRLADRLVSRYEMSGGAVRIVAPTGSAPLFTLRLCGFRPQLLVGSVAEALAAAP